MPKGAHLRKEQDLKRVRSVLLRFTEQEFSLLQKHCHGLGIERSEMVREAIFKAIGSHQPAREPQSAELPAQTSPPQPEKGVEEFLEELVQLYQRMAQKRGFDRKVDCNIYRATLHEFTNLLADYSQKALQEEFERYCNGLFTADFINSHLFRGFELHVTGNFVFWNKHNRGSSNYVGY